MTAHRRTPAELAVLVEAQAVIARLVDQCLTFTSPDGAHKALRSIYSRQGVCQTSRGCSDLCVEFHEAVAEGAAWLARHAGGGEQT